MLPIKKDSSCSITDVRCYISNFAHKGGALELNTVVCAKI